jgi:hypothetical protein
VHFLGWRLAPAQIVATTILVLASPPAIQGLRLQQLGLLVAFLIAASAALVVSGRLLWAGSVLALATIKPQMAALAIVFWLFWAAIHWKQRNRLILGFAAARSNRGGRNYSTWLDRAFLRGNRCLPPIHRSTFNAPALCGDKTWHNPELVSAFWHGAILLAKSGRAKPSPDHGARRHDPGHADPSYSSLELSPGAARDLSGFAFLAKRPIQTPARNPGHTHGRNLLALALVASAALHSRTAEDAFLCRLLRTALTACRAPAEDNQCESHGAKSGSG